MKVISWNILHGQPLPPPDPELDREQSEAVIRESAGKLRAAIGGDEFLLGLQEVDALQNRSASIHQTKLIAENLGADHWAYAPAIFGTPGEPWRSALGEKVKIFTESTDVAALTNAGPMYGIGLISSIPVRSWKRCELGKSPIGVNMRFPDGKGGFAKYYIQDENRVALAAELENGVTVVVTHLSFVPVFNFLQYWKILFWSLRLPGKVVILGDFNLPWNIPQKLSLRKSIKREMTFPIWEPKVQLDYILVPKWRKWSRRATVQEWEIPPLGISDHLPHGVDLRLL